MKMSPVFLWVLCVASAVDFTTASTEESSTSRSNTTPMNVGETQPRSFGPTDDGVHLRSTAVSEITVSPTEKRKEEMVSTDISGGQPVGLTTTSTVGAASTSLSQAQIPITTEASHPSTIKESASTSSDVTPPAPSATPSETSSASSPLLTPTSQLEVTSEVSSHVSSGANISMFSHSSSATTASGDVRSVATPVMVSTSPATQTSTSTESQSQSVSTIGGSSSAGSSYTLTSTDSPNFTSSFSTSPAGIIIPDPPMKSTPKSTITTQQVSKGPTTTEVSSCSTNSVVKHCLIIIATLAAIATIFIICTIVLCTKLSARRYSIRRNPQGTEMMCISNLLPDRNPTYSRQRNPVRNGILVIPGCGDSDEDGGDNLTLSSFLPDNDRYV